jgi:hypothetical protein
MSIASTFPARAVSWWKNYWFWESSGLRLGVCRFLACASSLILFRENLQNHLWLAADGTGYIDPQVIIRAVSAVVPASVFPTAGSLTALFWIYLVTGVLAAIGLFTRYSVAVFALASAILVAHRYSYGEQHHGEAFLNLFLFLLALSQSGRAFSVDAWMRRRPNALSGTTDMVVWPLRVMQIVMALGYFCAGLCKLHRGGLEWLNGCTLQHYLLQDGVRWERPVGMWLAQQHELCVVMSYGAVFVELFFFVGVLIPRIMPLFLIACGAMHTMIYIAQYAPFFQWVVLYSVFINFECLRRRGVDPQ